jgi:hypothetical protein
MVTQTNNDTPLELARRQREEETKQLMGFGQDANSKMELTEMQEIQNMFNTHKRMGSELLQAGKITTEQYYANSRKAGIKLGIIGPDEYPNDLPSWLKPTLEIGGAVIGGIIPYIGGPAGVGTKLVAESLGSGAGAATGTALYGMIADLSAPDGMPTQSWSEIGAEAAKDGAIVTGLTAGILKSIPAIGSLAAGAAKISPKSTALLKGLGKKARDRVVNSVTGQRLKAFGGGYLIKQEKIANELLQDLRNNGIEPSYSMLIQNDTVRSLIQALARTPLLGTPERESYELVKKDIFKRITEGVTPGSGKTLDDTLGAFSSNFVLEAGKYKLKKGVKENSLRDMSLLTGFMREQGGRSQEIEKAYGVMNKSILDDASFGSRLGVNEFTKTKEWWEGINNTAALSQSRGRGITDILAEKTSNTGLYFNLLFSPNRLADKKRGADLFEKERAKEILETTGKDFIEINGMVLPKYKEGVEGFIAAQEGRTIFASNDVVQKQLIDKLNNGGIPLGGTLPARFGTRSYNEIKQNPKLLEEFNLFLKNRNKNASDALKIKQTTSKGTEAKFVKKDGKETPFNAKSAEKYSKAKLDEAVNGKQVALGKIKGPDGKKDIDGNFYDASSILAAKSVSPAGIKFLNLSRSEQMLQAQRSLNDDISEIGIMEKSLNSETDLRAIGLAFNTGRATLKTDIQRSSTTEQVNLMDKADGLFTNNLGLLDRSTPFLQAYRQMSTGASRDKFLRMQRLFSGKVPRLDKAGDRIPNNFKADLVKDGERTYYNIAKDSQGQPIKMSQAEEVGSFFPIARGEAAERTGAKMMTPITDAKVVDDLYLNGSRDGMREFKELVGKQAFRKMAQDEVDAALNSTLIKYLNGGTDEGLDQFWKTFGLKTMRDGSEKAVKARMSTLIDEAGLAFKYKELESFGHMLKYLNGAPQLNQFIQRSMILRFSQGIGPGAVGGLFLGSAGTAGGLAGAGALGALGGLGVMYFLNKMMASRIYGNEVRGALRNYASAVAAGNKEKAEKIATGVLRQMEVFTVPFQKQMAMATSQTAINLGVTGE